MKLLYFLQSSLEKNKHLITLVYVHSHFLKRGKERPGELQASELYDCTWKIVEQSLLKAECDEEVM